MIFTRSTIHHFMLVSPCKGIAARLPWKRAAASSLRFFDSSILLHSLLLYDRHVDVANRLDIHPLAGKSERALHTRVILRDSLPPGSERTGQKRFSRQRPAFSLPAPTYAFPSPLPSVH